MITEGLTEDLFELSADVIVVGSGAAATAAAVAASHDGLDVVMLERAETIGGTTAISGSGAWIPNNRFMREAGIEDPREPALRYMASLSYPHRYDPDSPTLGLAPDAYKLIETFYDTASVAIDHFIDIGATDFIADMGLPDYFTNHPENKAPYGRKIHPPERRHGHAGAGPAHIARMVAFVERNGGIVKTNHRVVALLENASREIVGCEVHAGHRTILARARRAVIFGSGGFLHHEQMRNDYLLGPTYGGCATPSATGDFVTMGIDVGAALGNMSHAWWYQVCLDHAIASSHTAGGAFMPFGDSMIQVNRFGRRVVNEKAPYNERGPIHFLWDGLEYPNLVLFQIFDDDVRQAPFSEGARYPTPLPDEEVSYMLSAPTLEALADKIASKLHDVRAHVGGLQLAPDFVPNLKTTIERFNGFAERGIDEDFHRGEEPISYVWSRELRPESKNTMHPFRSTGPYHCLFMVAGALDTKGGPKTNHLAQVLNGRGEPIPGLYGAGNCVASPTAQAYWGPGATIGCAMTFGYIAGRAAKDEPIKEL